MANYYKSTHDVIIPSSDNYDSTIIKLCLPNHYSQWLILKKFINKNIFHLDLSSGTSNTKKDIEVTIPDLKLLMDDLEETYNSVAAKLGETQGSMDPTNTRNIADRLFKKWIA